MLKKKIDNKMEGVRKKISKIFYPDIVNIIMEFLSEEVYDDSDIEEQYFEIPRADYNILRKKYKPFLYNIRAKNYKKINN
jgi:hypothetical protein